MQKPKAADFDNEQDYLNNWAGWQAQSGSWSEPAPTDWKAPVVTPQPDGMLTNTTTPTEDTYTAPPTDYVPEYVQPKTTQVEDLFSNELGSSTEADDPFAIDVESEDTYTAPPADYVPEYTAPVAAATGYREDDDVSSSPEVETTTQAVDSWGRPDYSEYGERGRVVLSDSVTDFYTNMDTIDIPAMEGVDVVLGEGITEESLEQSRKKRAADFAAEQERIPQQREALANLFEEDQEKFKEVFEVLSVNNKLNFLNTLHTEGAFSKEDYLANAQQIMQQEQQRLYPDREEPLNYYFINNDYDTGDRLYEIPAAMADTKNPLLYAKEVVLFDDQTIRNARSPLIEPEEYFRQSLGKTNDENADKRSTWVASRDEFLIPMGRLALGIASGGLSEAAYTAARGLTGETLHGGDWATLGLAGLEMAGVITAPTEVVDPVTGEVVKTAGQGLSIGGLNLSYEATTSLIDGLGEKNPTAVVTSLMGDKWPDTLKGFGIPATLVDDPDFMKAFNKGLNVALDGGNLEDVLTESVEKYIKEGGSFGVLPEGDYDFSMFDGLGDVLEPFMDVLKEVAGAAEDLLKPVVNVIADAAEPIINTADDIIDATGDVIDDTVDVVADTFEPVVDVVDDIIDATGDTLEDLADALPDVPDVPDVPLPDVPLPDVPLPDLNLNLPSMGMLSGTRTTDSLFGKDLFKFKTKIGVSPQEQLMQAPQRKQQKQEYDNLFEDPFASTFNFKV